MKINFNIFKVKDKKKDSFPDFTMSVFDKETNQSKKVGACWIKKDKNGGTFLSCQYNDEYVAEPKTPTVQTDIDIDNYNPF